MKGAVLKVCGMREADNIRAVEALGIDMMGFIFYPRSPRYVAVRPAYLPKCLRVGVFVNESLDTMLHTATDYALDYIQLHGDEAPSLCDALRERGLKVIKSLHDPTAANAYADRCDYLLFDTPCAAYGGSGQTFDWEILRRYTGDTPFLLSGGIGVETLPQLQSFAHPRLAGYDVNSRFESAPGIKDVERLRTFVERIH
jgi:phosphoribosylanthranilate isomerase